MESVGILTLIKNVFKNITLITFVKTQAATQSALFVFSHCFSPVGVREISSDKHNTFSLFQLQSYLYELPLKN